MKSWYLLPVRYLLCMYLAFIEAYGSARVTQTECCHYSTPCSNIGAQTRKHMASRGKESHLNLTHACFHPKYGTWKFLLPDCQGWPCCSPFAVSPYHPPFLSSSERRSSEPTHSHPVTRKSLQQPGLPQGWLCAAQARQHCHLEAGGCSRGFWSEGGHRCTFGFLFDAALQTLCILWSKLLLFLYFRMTGRVWGRHPKVVFGESEIHSFRTNYRYYRTN